LEIIQSYNQNAVSVIDGEGKELVLIGKGIGFGKKKGDKIDIRKAAKVFQFYYSGYEKKIVDSIKDIPEDILLMAEEITMKANELLKEELNPAFLFTLATHIQYAISRTEEYGEIINPLNYELKYIYPKEYQVAKWAKNFLVNEYRLNLYDSEVTFFTLHFVNGLEDTNQINEVITLSNILSDITSLLDSTFDRPINKDSIFYSRFVLHLRYFVLKKLNKQDLNNVEFQELYSYVSDKFELANNIVNKIDQLLADKYNFYIVDDENLYLLLHVQRLIDDNKKQMILEKKG